jgi:hypothetical protein
MGEIASSGWHLHDALADQTDLVDAASRRTAWLREGRGILIFGKDAPRSIPVECMSARPWRIH